MSKKNQSDKFGFVYSTDPNFKFESEEEQAADTLQPAQQKLRIKLDTKQRGGKAVSIVENFIGTAEDLEVLGKQLKNYCGTGGSVKDGVAIVQGDQREKILQWLLKNGYKQTKKI
jgi:translation initiation factor 1